MQLFLIRHAQSQNNALPEAQRVEDPSLTEIGQQQARRLAEALPALELTHLITSPFRRALETTEHLRQAVGLIPKVRTDLHELGGCMRGPSLSEMVGAPGMNRDEIAAEFVGYQIADEIDGRGWWGSKPYETSETASLRADALLEQTRREFADPHVRVAYVMHADFKRIFLRRFFGVADVPWNTSLTSVQLTSDDVCVEDYNNIDHLPSELITG